MTEEQLLELIQTINSSSASEVEKLDQILIQLNDLVSSLTQLNNSVASILELLMYVVASAGLVFCFYIAYLVIWRLIGFRTL